MMRWGVLVCVLALAATSAGLGLETVPCPCSEPGAQLQDANLLSLKTMQEAVDLNATGLVASNETVDLTNNQPIDTEHQSVCVCKRMKKPTAPVRCSKKDLLHHNCNDRDEFRAAGYEIAPPGKVVELYPDEEVRPSAGKLFQDALVEATEVKNVAVEDKPSIGFVSHVQKPHKKNLMLSTKKIVMEPVQEPVQLSDAGVVPATVVTTTTPQTQPEPQATQQQPATQPAAVQPTAVQPATQPAAQPEPAAAQPTAAAAQPTAAAAQPTAAAAQPTAAAAQPTAAAAQPEPATQTAAAQPTSTQEQTQTSQPAEQPQVGQPQATASSTVEQTQSKPADQQDAMSEVQKLKEQIAMLEGKIKDLARPPLLD